MDRKFDGSAIKRKMDGDPETRLLSDFQEEDDLVEGLTVLNQLEADSEAEDIEYVDPSTGEDAESVAESLPPGEIVTDNAGDGGVLNSASNYNHSLKQFNPRNEFRTLGTRKNVLKTGTSKKRHYEVYYWRIQTKSGKPDLRSITVKVKGKNVKYTYAYCDWSYSHNESWAGK